MSSTILRTTRMATFIILILALLRLGVSPAAAAGYISISGQITDLTGGAGDVTAVEVQYALTDSVPLNASNGDYDYFGTLFDNDNVPIPASTITILPLASNPMTAVTDTNGRFDFSGRAVDASNAVISGGKISFTTTPPDQIHISSGIFNMTGKVTAGGDPVPNAKVFFGSSNYVSADTNGEFTFPVTATQPGSAAPDGIQLGWGAVNPTNSSGDYSIPNLPAGSYSVTPTDVYFTFDPTSKLYPNLSSNQTQDFKLGYAISGYVQIGGDPSKLLDGVTVSDNHGHQSPITGLDGEYNLSGLAPNMTYNLTASRNGYSFDSPSVNLATTNISKNIVATLDHYRLTVFVQDSQSNPLSGAAVAAEGITAVPDESIAGKYYLDGLIYGDHTITTQLPGYTFPNMQTSVQNNTSSITITGVKNNNITGTITYKGNPVKNAAVDFGPGLSATTDANGNYTLSAAPDSITLIPKLAGYSFTPSSISVDISGGNATQDFTADGTNTIHVEVQYFGTGLPTVSLVVSYGDQSYPVPPSTTGKFDLKVPFGTFTVTPGPTDYYTYNPTSKSFTFTDTGSPSVSQSQIFVAIGKYTVSGTITGPNSEPLEGIQVDIGSKTTPFSSLESTHTLSDGSYSFSGIGPGSYTIQPTSSIYAFSPALPSTSPDIDMGMADMTGRNFSGEVAHDATLQSLTTSIGHLSPAFSPGHVYYSLTLANRFSSVDLTPTLNMPGATLAVINQATKVPYPSNTIPLVVGVTNVEIDTTSKDTQGHNKYVVIITRLDNDHDTPLRIVTNLPQTATVDIPYTYLLVYSDDYQNATMTFKVNRKPSWLSYQDNHDGTITFSGTPTIRDTGSNPFVVQVTDDLTGSYGPNSAVQNSSIFVSAAHTIYLPLTTRPK